MEELDQEKLRSWMTTLESKLAELQLKIAPLAAEMDKTRQQIQLVGRLLGLENGQHADTQAATASTTNGSLTADALAEILRGEAPLHVSELKSRFLALGHTIPGKGTDSNLIAYLTRDSRFVRVARGTYGLSGSTTPTRPRRKRRRKRRKSSAGTRKG